MSQSEATQAELPDVPDCPGAALRVTRTMFAALRSGGEVFQTSAKTIPDDGLGDARVLCRNQVERMRTTVSNAVLYYGLCRSCTELEADNRAALRARTGER